VSDCGSMSRQTFLDNKPAIVAALRALMNNPKSRRRFRLLELYEKNTSELLAEVFGTTHGPVIVYRSYGSVNQGRNFAPFPRQSRGQDNLLVDPLTEDDDPDQPSVVLTTARNGQYKFRCADFRQWIAEGKTRHAVP
jgi:hypothetical protein